MTVAKHQDRLDATKERVTSFLSGNKNFVALAPKAYTAWNTLGAIHEALGHKDKALEAYQKAMALDPKHQTSRGHLKRLGALP